MDLWLVCAVTKGMLRELVILRENLFTKFNLENEANKQDKIVTVCSRGLIRCSYFLLTYFLRCMFGKRNVIESDCNVILECICLIQYSVI